MTEIVIDAAGFSFEPESLKKSQQNHVSMMIHLDHKSNFSLFRYWYLILNIYQKLV